MSNARTTAHAGHRTWSVARGRGCGVFSGGARSWALAVVVGLTAPIALTASVAAQDEKGVFSIAYENDVFAQADRHYTNGIRLSYLGAESNVPDWIDQAADAVPFLPEAGTRRVGFALGQSMFTPENISRKTPDPNDRPYVGWLYGSIGIVSELDDRLDILELDFGIVGPVSLADRTQKFVHDITGSTKPRGWDSQIPNEPGILVSYQRKWRGLIEASPFGLGIDFTPYAGGNLGNVLTQAVLGGTIRIGFDLPADFGPPRIRPSLTGSDYFLPRQTLGWYLFAGVEGRAVLRNIFLDGALLHDGPSVDKRDFVGDLQVGLAVTIRGVRLAYTHVFATKEFRGQTSNDSFGSFSVSMRF